MPRPLGEILPMGGIAPFGADCDELCKDGACNPADLSELSREFQKDCERSGDSAGKMCEDEAQKDASTALNALGQLLAGIAQGVNQYAQSELQADTQRGINQMREGQGQMMENGMAYNDAVSDYLGHSSNYGNLLNQLSGIQGTMSTAQSAISGYDAKINSINTQLQQTQQSLKSTESQLAYAKNPANYPRNLEGMKRQRADYASALTSQKNLSLQQNSLQKENAEVVSQRNGAVSTYNEARAQGEAVGGQVAQTQALASESRARAEQAQAGAQAGQQRMMQGGTTIREGLQEFRNTQKAVTGLSEASSASKGISQVLDHTSREEYYKASGDAMATGYGAYARMSGNPALVNATKLVSEAIVSASDAMERGGDFEQVGREFVKNFGQATLRTTDMARIADNVELADCIMNNPNNPNALYDGLSQLNTSTGDAVGVFGGIAETVAPFVPGGGLISPAIPALSNALGTTAQGLIQTTIDATNTAWEQGGLSAKVGNYPPRDIGRGLVERERGGPPSAGTVVMAGVGATLGEASYDLVSGAVGRNSNNADRASQIVRDIASTSAVPPLRTGEVSLRPPKATPVFAGD